MPPHGAAGLTAGTGRCIGTAGWSVPAAAAASVPGEGSHLVRYARVLNCTEINSSFYRPHRPQTYERWADSTPAAFRFAVKLPKQISHTCRLDGAAEYWARFADEAGALGPKWAVLLVQLPPSLALDTTVAGRFFDSLRPRFSGAVVCEPRHDSWFMPEAQALLQGCAVSRAAVDPARWPGAAAPGGHAGLAYFRWHGSPQVYRSSYSDAWLAAQARALAALPAATPRWCIFDNTASGAALPNALQLQALT